MNTVMVKRLNQNDLGFAKGVCVGVVIEYARLHFEHKLKSTSPISDDKLRAKFKNPSSNFLERIKSYQSFYQLRPKDPAKSATYKTSDEFYDLLDNSLFSNSEIIGLVLELPGGYAHAIAIKIKKFGEAVLYYEIFDPNLGESLPYFTKDDCIKRAIDLTLSAYGGVTSITAIDLGSSLEEIGLISQQSHNTNTANKYCYKIFYAIENSDLEKIIELNKTSKIDSTDLRTTYKVMLTSSKGIHFMPANPLELAIFKLDQEQLIQIISGNDKIDLSKSLHGIVLALCFAGKLSVPIIDALISKLPPDNSWIWSLFISPDPSITKTKAILNCFKSIASCSETAYRSIDNDYLHIKLTLDNKIIDNNLAKLDNGSFNDWFAITHEPDSLVLHILHYNVYPDP